MKKTKGIDKETFKRIFRDHYERFRKEHPRYNAVYYREAIKKMLGCADEKWGYARYLCMKCLAEKKVPFTCKSSFTYVLCADTIEELDSAGGWYVI